MCFALKNAFKEIPKFLKLYISLTLILEALPRMTLVMEMAVRRWRTGGSRGVVVVVVVAAAAAVPRMRRMGRTPCGSGASEKGRKRGKTYIRRPDRHLKHGNKYIFLFFPL